MGKIYQGQTDLTIRLETGKNLGGDETVQIAYRKPNREIGVFSAEIIDPVKGIIEFKATSDQNLSDAGEWTFWAKITDSNNMISIGEPSNQVVYKIGN